MKYSYSLDVLMLIQIPPYMNRGVEEKEVRKSHV